MRGVDLLERFISQYRPTIHGKNAEISTVNVTHGENVLGVILYCIHCASMSIINNSKLYDV